MCLLILVWVVDVFVGGVSGLCSVEFIMIF